MTGSRRYRLLCPLARALDHIGDRWTLLILRDLHAGPARFSELESGLTGIATNLLTDRLQQLMADGLVAKRAGEHGLTLYALTELGASTDKLLFELAMFGGQFKPDDELRRPGNLRLIVLSMRTALRRVVTPDIRFEAELNMDGERMTINVGDGTVEMRYAPSNSPDVVMITSYEPMIATADGEMPMEQFLQNHVQIITHTANKDVEFMNLMGAAMSRFAREG
ncbi:MAG: helix-turn-helix domain-containing protein [Proteobacteria bacterium]|nr:helix-turn-helix domain-containing protein [Pseudomonadota bacterium]